MYERGPVLWSREKGQPGGVPDTGRDVQPRPGKWVLEQGTWDVLCGKCQVGRLKGAERPRKTDAGTTAEGWYNGRSSVRWAETAIG